MPDDARVSRRRFIGAVAGTAAATSAVHMAPSAWSHGDRDRDRDRRRKHGRDHGRGRDDWLLAKHNIGIILYAVRDAVTRDPTSTDLPSGFREVFEAVAEIGYRQVEFAGYSQHANAEGGSNPGPGNPAGYRAYARMLRRWLNENHLEANGTHALIPGDLSQASLDRFRLELEFAAILGMDHFGTGNDPTNSRYRADWDVAADRWNQLGEIARREFDMKLYTHNHDGAYNFLLDAGPLDASGRPTRSTGMRMLEYGFRVLDPRYVFFELDVFWAYVARHRFRTYTGPDGTTLTDVFDPAATVIAEERRTRKLRFPLFHAKDGRSTGEPPGTGPGYAMVPFGQGDIDFADFFDSIRRSKDRIAFWEQDNAPGGAANPSQALEFADISYDALRELREPEDDCRED